MGSEQKNRRKIYLTIFLSLIVLLFFVKIQGCGIYSEGSRAGVVTKLSLSGVFFKSYEGELLMVVPSETGFAIAERFWFSIPKDDKDVAEKVFKAQRSGERVHLVYWQWFIKPCRVSTFYKVVDVQ